MSIRILLLEDEPDQLKKMKAIIASISSYDINLECYSEGIGAYDAVMKKTYDVCLLDFVVPGLTGIELAQKLEENNSKIQIVMITSQIEKEKFRQNSAIKYWLLKPAEEAAIRKVIIDVCESVVSKEVG